MSDYCGGSENGGVDWEYFDRYTTVIEKYLPNRGEGATKATQAVTAVNKLIYKWFNDGDVYDNTHTLTGWLNNLSSYANWLDEHIPACMPILARIGEIGTQAEYEHILKDLADTVLGNEDLLDELNHSDLEGTIYDCPGPYEFVEGCEEDEDEDEYEDEED